MRRTILNPAALLLALVFASGAALAAGGGGSSAPRQNQDLVTGAALIEDGRYGAAVPLLQKVVAVEPHNADAYNYLGFIPNLDDDDP